MSFVAPRNFDIEKELRRKLDLSRSAALEWKKHFGERKAEYQMATLDLFETVCKHVNYLPNDMLDVTGLVQFVIGQRDRLLFRDVCKFLIQYFDGKPLSDATLREFRALLTLYLVKAGF